MNQNKTQSTAGSEATVEPLTEEISPGIKPDAQAVEPPAVDADAARSNEEAVARLRAQLARRPADNDELGGLSMVPAIVLGLMIWGVAGLGVAALFSQWAQSFFVNYWKWLLLAFGVTVALIPVARTLDAKLRSRSPEVASKTAAYVIVLCITLSIMGLIGFGSTPYLTLAAQLIVIPVTALLPAVTYFLFLSSRRPSILNEFIGNLSRLGLFKQRNKESGEERLARIESYFQRFEAIYGVLRFEKKGEARVETRRQLVEHLAAAADGAKDLQRLPQSTVLIGDLFHSNLVIPIGLVTILTSLGWVLVLQPTLDQVTTGVADLVPKLTPLNFAFLGAYFFGIQMLFRRFVRRDLGPNAYFSFANRIILALIGMWVVVLTFGAFPEEQPTAPAPQQASVADAGAKGMTKEDPTKDTGKPAPAPAAVVAAQDAKGASADMVKRLGASIGATVSSRQAEAVLLLAFTIGVFPRVLWQFLTAGAARLFRVKVVLPSVQADQPLSHLDGLTVWHETRLEEEDVENVPNMASVDVVEVILHTQIPIERLISWIDQAILQTALGPNGKELCDKLRGLGYRTATQIFFAQKAGGQASNALGVMLGADKLAALVLALEKEVNFDLMSEWRQVA